MMDASSTMSEERSDAQVPDASMQQTCVSSFSSPDLQLLGQSLSKTESLATSWEGSPIASQPAGNDTPQSRRTTTFPRSGSVGGELSDDCLSETEREDALLTATSDGPLVGRGAEGSVHVATVGGRRMAVKVIRLQPTSTASMSYSPSPSSFTSPMRRSLSAPVDMSFGGEQQNSAGNSRSATPNSAASPTVDQEAGAHSSNALALNDTAELHTARSISEFPSEYLVNFYFVRVVENHAYLGMELDRCNLAQLLRALQRQTPHTAPAAASIPTTPPPEKEAGRRKSADSPEIAARCVAGGRASSSSASQRASPVPGPATGPSSTTSVSTSYPQQLLEVVLPLLAHDVLKGLRHLHGEPLRRCHNDVKPANILLRSNGRGFRLADFGCSVDAPRSSTPPGLSPGDGSAERQQMRPPKSRPRRSVDGDALHVDPNLSRGAVMYQSPERFTTHQCGSPGSDIWSLGVVMAEAVDAEGVGLAVREAQSFPVNRRWRSLARHLVAAVKNSELVRSVLLQPQRDASAAECFSAFLDFLSLCLKPSPECRPTVSCLLEHAWLKRHNSITKLRLSLKALVARTPLSHGMDDTQELLQEVIEGFDRYAEVQFGQLLESLQERRRGSVGSSRGGGGGGGAALNCGNLDGATMGDALAARRDARTSPVSAGRLFPWTRGGGTPPVSPSTTVPRYRDADKRCAVVQALPQSQPHHRFHFRKGTSRRPGSASSTSTTASK